MTAPGAGTPAAATPGRSDVPWYALGLEGADIDAEVADLRKRVHHLGAALAGENEGIRLWMLDCGNLVDQFRRERDRLAAELDDRTALYRDGMAEASELRQELAEVRKLAGDLERDRNALLAGRDSLTGLVDEITAYLAQSVAEHAPRVGPAQIAKWRERAGLET